MNADSIIGANGGIMGYNMFTYCNNNPVMFADPSGQAHKKVFGAFSDDIHNPWRESLCGGGGVAGMLITALLLVALAQQTSTIATSVPKTGILNRCETKEKEADETVDDTTSSYPTVTKIYRYGGTNPSNLTPKPKDLIDGRGLSFSTNYMPGCSVTTIEAINATGIVYAIRDGANHVSVYPIGGTMRDWVEAGPNSIWTKAVKSVTVKFKG